MPLVLYCHKFELGSLSVGKHLVIAGTRRWSVAGAFRENRFPRTTCFFFEELDSAGFDRGLSRLTHLALPSLRHRDTT